jgi:hypothetical protein
MSPAAAPHLLASIPTPSRHLSSDCSPSAQEAVKLAALEAELPDPDDSISEVNKLHHGLSAIGWYATLICSSIAMTCLNKFVATGFHDHFVLLFVQAGMSVSFNLLGTKLAIFPPLKPFTRQQFLSFSLPSVIFTCMLVTSLAGLPYVSVPTVVVFRAVATVVIAMLDVVIFKNEITRRMAMALVVVVVGAAIYSMYDITYNRIGYMWMALNMGLMIVVQFAEKYTVSSTVDQTSEGMAIIQNLYLMVIALCMSAFASENPVSSFKSATFSISIGILLTGVVGFTLNLATIQLNKVAFATSIALAGWFSKVSSLIIGPALFHNQVTLVQLLGAFTSMMGVAAYSDRVWDELKKRPLGAVLWGMSMLALAAVLVNAS